MSVETLTGEIRRRAAQNPKLGYRLKFELAEGGVILWDGTAMPAVIDNSDGESDTTICLSEDNLRKLIAGELDPTLAYMTGKIKIEGSMGVALKLAAMLGD